MWSGTDNWENVNELTITKINEVFNLHQNCSDDSYYQCLAKRFAKINLEEAKYVAVNGSNCSFDKLCAPFSLPFDDGCKIPMCTTEIDQACYGQMISQKLEPDQATHCQKSCHVKEFSIKKDSKGFLPPGGEYKYRVATKSKNNQELVIEIKFDTAPQSSWKVRTHEPFKTVKKEYWIMSDLSFIGYVGGTLGMFVGFSFFGLGEWFIGSAAALWRDG